MTSSNIYRIHIITYSIILELKSYKLLQNNHLRLLMKKSSVFAKKSTCIVLVLDPFSSNGEPGQHIISN